MHQKHSSCPICESKNIQFLNGYEKLLKCLSCKIIFQNSIPTDKELIDYYAQYPTYKQIDDLTFASYKKIIKMIEPFRNKNALLEIGCGNGFLLDTAKENNWDIYGTEIDPNSLNVCRRKNIPVKENISEFNDKTFDCGIMIEVIEHLKNPDIMIKDLSAVLRSGGCVYISTPNFNSLSRRILKSNWSVITYPEHLFYFTPASIDYLFRKNGFEKVFIKTTGVSPGRWKSDFHHKENYDTQEFHKVDQDIKNKLNSNKLLTAIKSIINFWLNLFKSGDTIKCLYIKK